MPKWSDEDLEYLSDNYESEVFSKMEDRLDRSRRAIETKASRMGLSRTPNWSEEEVKYLVDNYEDTANSEICKAIGRSESAIYNKAYSMDLKSDRTMMRRSDIKSSELSPPDLSDYEIGFLCGLVSGEGSFVVRSEPNDRNSFSLDIMMKEEDIIRQVKQLIGFGSVYNSGDMYSYSVRDVEILWNVVVPVFDSANFMYAKKEQQYEHWKQSIAEYYDL